MTRLNQAEKLMLQDLNNDLSLIQDHDDQKELREYLKELEFEAGLIYEKGGK